ncbi:unnamed protein product [Prunus armeniaca]
MLQKLHHFPYGWSRYANFSFTLVNQLDTNKSTRKGILIQIYVRISGDGLLLMLFFGEGQLRDRGLSLAREGSGPSVKGWPAEDKTGEAVVKLRTPVWCRPKALRCLSQLGGIEDAVHQTLIRGLDTLEAEGHDFVAVKATIRDEGGVGLVLRMHENLVVPKVSIHEAEEGVASCGIN